jgi:hypothetical protein
MARRLQGQVVRTLIPTLLSRASQIAGGWSQLAYQLGVSETRLGYWRSHRLEVPEAAFLALVDIVLRDDIRRAAQDRRHSPRAEDIAVADE